MLAKARRVAPLLVLVACRGKVYDGAAATDASPPSAADAVADVQNNDAGGPGAADARGDASAGAPNGTGDAASDVVDADVVDADVMDSHVVGADVDATASSGVTFSAVNAISVAAIGIPQALAIGDVNGDGRMDVVLGNQDPQTYTSNILIFYQASDGTLPSTPVTYTFGWDPLAIADVNGDGRSDILAGSGTSFAVALQAADGTLTPAVSYPVPMAGAQPQYAGWIVTGDFDRNGKTDVVVTSGGPSSSSVFLFAPNATGTLGSPRRFTTLGGAEARVADYNADGLPDLITFGSPGSATAVGVLPLLSPGVFGSAIEANHAAAALGTYFDVGDVTSDGLIDVVSAVSANSPNGRVLVSPQSDGVLAGPSAYDSTDLPGPVRIADVNMDGRNDVVVEHAGWFAAGVYLQKADGTLAPEVLLRSSYGQRVLAVGDVNGDGKPDIVTADQQKLVVFYNEY